MDFINDYIFKVDDVKMKIDSVYAFLKSLPNKESGDQKQLMIRCPFCGDSTKHSDSKHFSIKVDVDNNEPMLYKCFRADYLCGAKGILDTKTLQLLGCSDMRVLLDLAEHNSHISKSIDRFNPKIKRLYAITNANTIRNDEKARYINDRLGISFTPADLKEFKIQLSLWDFLRINNIRKLSFSQNMCDRIDECTVGFMSAYNDYIIFRDITGGQMKTRYTMYRTSGESGLDDTKLYVIPTEIDLMDPRSANLNIAEGPFSILGAYIHCNIGKDRRNNIFAANCGTGYRSTIDHLTKQYGFLKVRIHIWSDSEVPTRIYQKLYDSIKDRLDIRAFEVHYNKKAEDFGHAAKNIQIETLSIK